eukprot:7622164-Alexandrium_andersonii.AAC.1
MCIRDSTTSLLPMDSRAPGLPRQDNEVTDLGKIIQARVSVRTHAGNAAKASTTSASAPQTSRWRESQRRQHARTRV